MFNGFSGYPPPTNPYSNMSGTYYSMTNQPTSTQSMPNRYEIVRVNGENGAKSFRMAPNSQCILLDETAPVVWLCQSDGAGYHTVTPYTITPHQAAQQPDINSLENRIKRLEELYESNVTNVKQSGTTPAE